MVISSTYNALANARSLNVLSGEQFEFVPGRAALIRLRCSTPATGVRVDFQIGGETVLTNALVSNSNRFPIQPDDVLLNDTGGRGGERLFMTFYNTTGGAILVTYVIDIVPI